MALPLPRVIPDVGPGGGIVTAMGGINKLANDMTLRKINEVKEQYAPLTTQAEAASKLAYANLVNPQYIAKIMGNPQFMANLSEEQKNMLKDLAYSAGVRNQGTVPSQNPLAQLQGQAVPEDHSFTGWLKNSLKNAFPRGQQQQAPTNALANMGNQVAPQMARPEDPYQHRPKDGVTLEGAQWYNKKGEPVYEEDVQTPDGAMQLELTKGVPGKTYAENAGDYQGAIKQGEEAAKLRAQSIGDIGEEMKQLSTTGANVDRLIDDFTNPDFMAMREEFPFFQDTQLKALSHVGDERQRNMIGNLIANIESFKGSTVNGFKGQTLKREFDYADKLKPTENDTVYTALGKLQTLKALKDIAWQKNVMIKNLMERDRLSLADAVERVDQKIDIKSIDKAVREYTQPMYKLRNPKTGQTIMVPKKRAQELGVKNV